MSMTIDQLLAPLSFAEFQQSYFEKQPLLIRRQTPDYYAAVLTLRDIDQHLGEAKLSSSAVRMVRQGTEFPARQMACRRSPVDRQWVRGTINKDVLFARFYEGYTVVLLEYQRHHAAMLRLVHDVERALHAPAMCQIYLTPRDAQGFTPHWDTSDTMILQFTGRKEWRIYDSPIALPTPELPLYPGEWTPVEPSMTVTLEAGDFLYIPRGFVHEARALDAVSGHILIAPFVHTYADLLRQIADNAHADPWMRRGLPADFASVAADGEFLRRVHRFFDRADLRAYLERMHEDFAEQRVPDATDRLHDYVGLPSLGATTRLRTRSIVLPELSTDGSGTVLAFHRKKLTFPAEAAESIRFMIAMREFDVHALPGAAEANVDLCGTLVREGFLTIVS